MSDGTATPSGVWIGETRPAVDSATVLLLRDGPDGVEVFLLERHLDSDFAGGAFVFPGGKVDDADRTFDPARWTGLDPAAVREEVGAATDADALGLYVAAVRETFEESGVLLGTRGGAPITADDLASESFLEARRRLNARGEPWDWSGWLADEDIVLDLGALAFWSWWATPEGRHMRFDTRFFVALVPPEQESALAHDEVEMTSSCWLSPAAALREQESGRVPIIFPTRRNLRDLAAYGSADEAWEAAASGRTDRRRVQPRVVRVGGTPMVQHPFEEHPEPL